MKFELFNLGLIEYLKAGDFQKEIFIRVKERSLGSALIICRHYLVITLGRRANAANILASPQELTKSSIQVRRIERGGDVTYHGPGQLIAWPVFNLQYLKKDIHWFLRGLEEVIIGLLSEFGVQAQRQSGLTGVWIGREKISSIGLAIKNWITFHGLSLNIKRNDLTNFSLIRPCGMNIRVTALENILNRDDLEIDLLKKGLVNNFNNVFN